MVKEGFMRLILLFCTLMLSACAAITSSNGNYTQTVSSWRWASASALLQNWGRPTKVGKLPNGNLVYIYHKESYKNYPPSPITTTYSAVSVAGGRNVVLAPSSNQQPPPTASYLLECTTIFEIDPRHVIVDARARGNNCTGDNGFMLSRSNPHPRAQEPAAEQP